MNHQMGSGEEWVAPDTLSVAEIGEIFQRLKSRSSITGNAGVRDRIQRLKAFKASLIRHQDEIREALRSEFGKHPMETDMSEVLPVTDEIHLAINHLRYWMHGADAGTPLLLIGTRSRVAIQPKGVVLILSPWNFPINLSFVPLVSAIAAGNTVILKPSEHAPHACRVMETIVKEAFHPDEVALIQGGIGTADALLDLPFNHIFFTGSPAVGKIVMTKAARHLSSVTLELGGKSPTIVDQSADIRLAAKRIAFGKVLNAGQICISPDYVLVEESQKEQLLHHLKTEFNKLCGTDPVNNANLARIINRKHFDRLSDYVDTAVAAGARIRYGGNKDAKSRYLHPTIITDIPEGHPLLTDEIFGPILPVLTYQKREQAVTYIHERPKPLSLYIFARDKKAQNYYMANTRSGTTCINTVFLQFMNNELPFGGDNNSGIGKAHGFHGFMAFSNQRSVLRQVWPVTAPDIVAPPYSMVVQKIINTFINFRL